MRPLLNFSFDTIELNALFMQPTRWCGLNCRGCYVKAHDGGEAGFHTPWDEQLKLFKMFFLPQYDKYWSNQITISVDDLHKDPEKRDHMVNLVGWVTNFVSAARLKGKDYPEVHMTMHTPRTWYQYIDNNVCIGDGLSMVSFSELPLHLPETNEVLAHFEMMGVPVNYNKLVPSYKTGIDWNKEAAKYTTIGRKVSSIYMVMNKRPVGLAKKDVISPADTESMTSDIVYMENILSRVPDDVKAKIKTDGCLRDTAHNARTGNGCASGVSRFQVWPDGTVSGCPYAFRGMGTRAETAEDIVANIKHAKGTYEFQETCHLPTVYSSIRGLGEAKYSKVLQSR